MKSSPLLISITLSILALVVIQCSPIDPNSPVSKPNLNRLPDSRNPKQANADRIEIQQVDRRILVDLQYTRPTGIAKFPLYDKKFPALLRPETALRLKHANAIVRKHGLRIKVWDAYRPQEAQIALWEASGKKAGYVADPYTKPSLHTKGVAVDVTLAYPDGTPVVMPTKFDDFSHKAAPSTFHPNPLVRRNLRILREVMTESGFQHIRTEWWHFLDSNFEKYETIPKIDS